MTILLHSLFLAALALPLLADAAPSPQTLSLAQVRASLRNPGAADKPITFVVNLQLDKMPQGASVGAHCLVAGVGGDPWITGSVEAPTTVGADGRWNGSVNVVVAVPLDKVPLMDSWWCMGHASTGPLQSPTWVKVFHDQVLVGNFSK